MWARSEEDIAKGMSTRTICASMVPPNGAEIEIVRDPDPIA